MAWINTTTLEYPLSEADIRRKNPRTSYPAVFAPGEPYAWVFPASQPHHDPVTRFVRETAPVKSSGGEWVQQWEVVPRFTQYTDAQGVTNTVAAQEAAALVADAAAKKAALIEQYEAALDAHLDTKAQERRYLNRITCALRAGFPGPYQAEGTAFAQWMDACNVYAFAQIALIEAGQRPMPSVEAFIEELPDLVWPA